MVPSRRTQCSWRHRRRSPAGCCWIICALMAAIEIRLASQKLSRSEIFGPTTVTVQAWALGARSRFAASENQGCSWRIAMALKVLIWVIDNTVGHREGAVIYRIDAIASDAETRSR